MIRGKVNPVLQTQISKQIQRNLRMQEEINLRHRNVVDRFKTEEMQPDQKPADFVTEKDHPKVKFPSLHRDYQHMAISLENDDRIMKNYIKRRLPGIQSRQVGRNFVLMSSASPSGRSMKNRSNNS